MKTKPNKVVECNGASCTSRLVGERCAYGTGRICPINPLESESQRVQREAVVAIRRGLR